MLRLEAYRTGGGQAGNVGPRPGPGAQDQRARTSPGWRTASPAIGGAEAETLADAKARGPLLLRSRGRAVTAEDFEELARDVAPDAARVHCVPGAGAAARASGCSSCRTWPATSVGRIERADLDPPCADRWSGSANSLDERRLVGTRLLVQPPDYRG